ncbi:hypothetical protein H4Q26_002825 [Puccinia striiformis f. sp. tritici PST-130]|nr:hypothetical protein H4Q26_002825 [Puccinia striiformis f. sp. tritici PST-130]
MSANPPSHKFLKKPRVAAVIPCPFVTKSGGRRWTEPSDPRWTDQSIESVGYSTILDELNLDNKTLMSTINSHTDKGEMIVTIGGDHSLAIGTLSGTLNAFPEACVIWVDAHADINTPESTETGNLHGCPVSFLLSTLHAGKDIEPFKWIKPCLQPDRLVYIGLRDIDMGERKILQENNIRCFTMHDIDRHGIGKVIEMALESVNKDLKRPIHLSFDVDALDPSVAPSTGTPVRGD